MKLATRYQRIHLVATLSLFLLASVAFYLLLYRVLVFQLDEDLEIEQHEIQTYLHSYGTLPQNIVPVEDQMVSYEKTNSLLRKPVLKTVVLRDVIEKKEGSYRQLIFTAQTGGQVYRISISKSMEGVKGLAKSIGIIALVTIALMLLVSFIINRLVLQRLWQPFYTTIKQLEHFKLAQNIQLQLPDTRTDEFSLLNKALLTTTGKAARDYEVLKEFTENASHELQTPLAIIRSRMDLLIQDEDLSERQSDLIHDTYKALRRMTHLNGSLLLLSKIENGQYGERSRVDGKALLEEKLIMFEPFLKEKDLHVTLAAEPAMLFMNPSLADILVSNLLSNAIHHNRQGGRIDIKLDSESLSVCNTAEHPALQSDHLFRRFNNASTGATRTGLGLAIAKQVCDASGCSISYQYDADMHCFSVQWKTVRLLQV